MKTLKQFNEAVDADPRIASLEAQIRRIADGQGWSGLGTGFGNSTYNRDWKKDLARKKKELMALRKTVREELIEGFHAPVVSTAHKKGDTVQARDSIQGLKAGQKYKVTGVARRDTAFGTFVTYELDGKHSIGNGHLVLSKVNEDLQEARGGVFVQGAFGKGPKPSTSQFRLGPDGRKRAPGEDKDHSPKAEGPYYVGWSGQSHEWYGDEAPETGKGRYKPKGDGGRIMHINVPSYQTAMSLAKQIDAMHKSGKMDEPGVYGKYGKDGYLIDYHGAYVVPHSKMDDYTKEMLSYQQKGHERWRARDHSDPGSGLRKAFYAAERKAKLSEESKFSKGAAQKHLGGEVREYIVPAGSIDPRTGKRTDQRVKYWAHRTGKMVLAEDAGLQDGVKMKNMLATIEHLKKKLESAKIIGKQGLIDHYQGEITKWNAVLSTHTKKVTMMQKLKAAQEAGWSAAEAQRQAKEKRQQQQIKMNQKAMDQVAEPEPIATA